VLSRAGRSPGRHPQLGESEIQSIEIAAYGEAVRMIGSDPSRWAPRSRETADHSLPFIVATCLSDGMVNGASFSDDELDRNDLVDLMAKTRVEASPQLTGLYPQAMPARVTVCTSAGESYVAEVHFPKGHSSDPMSDGEVERKFVELCSASGNARAIDLALSDLWSIEKSGDVAATIPPRLHAIRCSY
jgi:2-methylcitrate dehydratase